MQRLRGRRIALILQDRFPMMNPLMRAGAHIEEMLARRPEFAGRQRGQKRCDGVSPRSGSPTRTSLTACRSSCPAACASALRSRRRSTGDPELLIADEPSTALDVTTQAEIMRLIKRVQETRGMGLILITHNLRLAFSTCDRVMVLYAGSLLEVGDGTGVGRGLLNGQLSREQIYDVLV